MGRLRARRGGGQVGRQGCAAARARAGLLPVERYTVGRIGTEREHAKADFADPGAVGTVLEEMTSRDFTVEGRVAELERAARAYLQQQGMPDDLNAPCYADPAWLRKNERWSLVWYSIEMLR